MKIQAISEGVSCEKSGGKRPFDASGDADDRPEMSGRPACDDGRVERKRPPGPDDSGSDGRGLRRGDQSSLSMSAGFSAAFTLGKAPVMTPFSSMM